MKKHLMTAVCILLAAACVCLSAALVLIELCRSKTCIRLRFRDLRINGEMLRKTVKVGLPAGLQMAVTSLPKVDEAAPS